MSADHGAVNIAGRPDVVAAASPTYALAMVAKDPLRAFLTLGTVVLTITGAGSLPADSTEVCPPGSMK